MSEEAKAKKWYIRSRAKAITTEYWTIESKEPITKEQAIEEFETSFGEKQNVIVSFESEEVSDEEDREILGCDPE